MRNQKYIILAATFIVVFFLLFSYHRTYTENIATIQQELHALRETTTLLQDGLSLLSARSAVLESLVATQDAERAKLASLQEESVLLLEQLTTNVTTLSKTDIVPIIAKWQPFVYSLSCTFDIETRSGEPYTARGSALLERTSAGTLRLITNRHVLEEREHTPLSCVATHPSFDDDIDIDGDAIALNDDIDFGFATIDDVDALTRPALSQTSRCTAEPKIGDAVVILGYPGIGAQESVTATEGIISGFDEDNYLTSGKIDTGSSGGAAVHVTNNCLVGLPTIVFRGSLESLARILPLGDL